MKILKKYYLPLFCILVWLAVFGLPMWLVKINPPPPESELRRIHAKILGVYDRSPNLRVLVNGRSVVDFDFPSPLYLIFSKQTSMYLLSNEEKARLTGCEADLYGENVKYLWPHTFRVWAIDCKAQPVDYHKIAQKSVVATKQVSFAPWFGGAVSFLFAIITFVQARRKK